MKISAVIPCYNEKDTIEKLVDAVRGAPARNVAYQEGKKITWKDGIRAIYAIIKYNFFTASPRAIVANTLAVVSSVSQASLPAAVKAC